MVNLLKSSVTTKDEVAACAKFGCTGREAIDFFSLNNLGPAKCISKWKGEELNQRGN